MKKNEQQNKYSFEFDEQGTNEVSEQIMNAYNSGYIDDGDFQASANESSQNID